MQTSNPDKVRRHGRCPLTPEEVGLMLRLLEHWASQVMFTCMWHQVKYMEVKKR